MYPPGAKIIEDMFPPEVKTKGDTHHHQEAKAQVVTTPRQKVKRPTIHHQEASHLVILHHHHLRLQGQLNHQGHLLRPGVVEITEVHLEDLK